MRTLGQTPCLHHPRPATSCIDTDGSAGKIRGESKNQAQNDQKGLKTKHKMTRRMAPCSVIEKYSSLVDNGWVVVMLCATVPRPQNPAAHQENSFVWVLIGRNEEAASDNHLMSRLCGHIWIINRDLGPGHSGARTIFILVKTRWQIWPGWGSARAHWPWWLSRSYDHEPDYRGIN